MVLPRLTILDQRYVIGRTLEASDPFWISYQAWNLKTEEQVDLVEYYPRALVARGADGVQVEALDAAEEDVFRFGRDQFLKEGTVLADLAHPSLERPLELLEAHNTVYRVVTHRTGATLASILAQQGGRLAPRMALTILMPVMEGLYAAHQKGLIHGAISPDALFLSRGNGPILRGFRTAYLLLAQKSGAYVAPVPDSYVAPEQEQPGGRLGPWTDVYGCAATLVHMLTGRRVPPSLETDDLTAFLEDVGGLNPALQIVLRQALVPNVVRRLRSLKTFQKLLLDAYSEAEQAPAPDAGVASAETTNDGAPLSDTPAVAEAGAIEEETSALDEAPAPTGFGDVFPEASSEAEPERVDAPGEGAEGDADLTAGEARPGEASYEPTGWADKVFETPDAPVDESPPARSAAGVLDEPASGSPWSVGTADQAASWGDGEANEATREVSTRPWKDARPEDAPETVLEEEIVPTASMEPAEEDDVADEPDEHRPAPTDETYRPSQSNRSPADFFLVDEHTGSTAQTARAAVRAATEAAAEEPVPPAARRVTPQMRRPDRPPLRLRTMPMMIGLAVLVVIALGSTYVVLQSDGSNGTQFTYFRTQGDSLFALANYAAAKTEYEHALAARPDDDYVTTQLELAEQRLEAVAVARYAEHMLHGDSLREEADSRLEQGEALRSLGYYAEANKAYYEALRYRPNDPVALERGKQTADGMARALQVNQQRAGTPMDASAPVDLTTRRQQLYVNYRQQGDELFAAGDYAGAQRKFREALDYRPGDAYATSRIRDVEGLMARADREAEYQRAVVRGQQLCDQGRCDEARADFERALELKPGDQQARAGLAQADSMLATTRQNEQQYQYYRGRGDGLMAEGDYGRAVENYQQALRYKPGDTYVQRQIDKGMQALAPGPVEVARPEQAPRPEASPAEPAVEDGVYVVVEEAPRLIDGLKALNDKVRVPSMAIEAGVSGRVYVQFIIDEQGNVQAPEVIRGLGAGCDEEALRVIRTARFEPGKVGGRPVKMRHTLFVVFPKN